MKICRRIFFLFLCAFLLAACETAKNENAALNENAAAQNRNASAANAANAAGNENKPAAANVETEKSFEEKNDFEGTAGITDKKYKIKETAVLSAVRTARHKGFDRVVFEFSGAEMPSYHIEYVDRPVRACGSGEVVPLKGDGWLEIRFYPAAAHTEEGRPTVENRQQTPNHEIIKELKATCDFEAEVAWVLGVASPNRYRVLELKNPTRLAVDIKH